MLCKESITPAYQSKETAIGYTWLQVHRWSSLGNMSDSQDPVILPVCLESTPKLKLVRSCIATTAYQQVVGPHCCSFRSVSGEASLPKIQVHTPSSDTPVRTSPPTKESPLPSLRTSKPGPYVGHSLLNRQTAGAPTQNHSKETQQEKSMKQHVEEDRRSPGRLSARAKRNNSRTKPHQTHECYK